MPPATQRKEAKKTTTSRKKDPPKGMVIILVLLLVQVKSITLTQKGQILKDAQLKDDELEEAKQEIAQLKQKVVIMEKEAASWKEMHGNMEEKMIGIQAMSLYKRELSESQGFKLKSFITINLFPSIKFINDETLDTYPTILQECFSAMEVREENDKTELCHSTVKMLKREFTHLRNYKRLKIKKIYKGK